MNSHVLQGCTVQCLDTVRCQETAEWLRLAGISGDHLVQPCTSSRVTKRPLTQNHILTAFEYLQGRRFNEIHG